MKVPTEVILIKEFKSMLVALEALHPKLSYALSFHNQRFDPTNIRRQLTRIELNMKAKENTNENTF